MAEEALALGAIKAGGEITSSMINGASGMIQQSIKDKNEWDRLNLQQKQFLERFPMEASLKNNLQKMQNDAAEYIARLQSEATRYNSDRMFNSNQLTTDTQKQLQQQNFEQANNIRKNLEANLKAAGLPSYLAYIQPDASLMEIRQIRGVNFNQTYKRNLL